MLFSRFFFLLKLYTKSLLFFFNISIFEDNTFFLLRLSVASQNSSEFLTSTLVSLMYSHPIRYHTQVFQTDIFIFFYNYLKCTKLLRLIVSGPMCGLGRS